MRLRTFALAYGAAILLAVVTAGQHQTSVGDVVLTIVIAAALVQQLSGLIGMVGTYQALVRADGRIHWLERYAQATSAPPADPVPPPSSLRHGIAVEAVSFSYPGGSPVLSGIDLTLEAGSVIALVGENGAGKTTLVKLLSGLCLPTSGRITADGIDIARIDRALWQQRVAACFQDFQQLELVARESIGVGDLPRLEDASAIQAAVGRAGAEFLMNLPQELETQLGLDWPGGVQLSGGQWQKVALARGLTRDDPLLLVLDEPTAALDAQTEHALFERISAAARSDRGRKRVTILVSHRFSTVRMADIIHVLEGGRVVESGTHAALMRRSGRYAELFEIQAGAYR